MKDERSVNQLSMLLGVLLGVAAGAFWGLLYIAPLMVPDYNPVLVALSRYIAFGIVSLPFMYFLRKDLKRFTKADIIESFKLPLFGNVLFYITMAICIRMAGAPLAGMFMAIIPVMVAIASNFRYQKEGRALSWGVITPPLVVIFFGMVIANWSEFQYMTAGAESPLDFWIGVAFGIVAAILWTWFSIMNGEWLLAHPSHNSAAWTALQGVTVLPVVTVAWAVVAWPMGYLDTTEGLFGPEPINFLWVALMLGFVCSWVAMLCWNGMSQRLPSALGGQLIVFESISSVIYAMMFRGEMPTVTLVIGYTILLIGVMGSLYVFRQYTERMAKQSRKAELAAARQKK